MTGAPITKGDGLLLLLPLVLILLLHGDEPREPTPVECERWRGISFIWLTGCRVWHILLCRHQRKAFPDFTTVDMLQQGDAKAKMRVRQDSR